MSSKNKTPLKKLFDYFDSFLLIDKSVDLLLIFVGLVAALAFENYVEQNAREKQYIENLTRLHTEISTNIVYNETFDLALKEYSAAAQEIMEVFSLGYASPYDGINRIINIESTLQDFELNAFNSLNSEDFLSKELYSEVLHVYQLYTKAQSMLNIPIQSLKELYHSYNSLYVGQTFGPPLGQDVKDVSLLHIRELIYNYETTTKYLPKIKNELIGVENTSKRVIDVIENELIFYKSAIEKSQKYTDYY